MLGRPPDTSTSARAPPPPLGPLGPPRARGVTAPLLSFLRSAPCQEEGALLRPKGQGPRPSAGGARVRGDPRQRRGLGGRRGGGRWPGQCVGGEGSRTAAAAASSLRPPQLFVQPREVPASSPSGSCHGLHRGRRAAELGAGSPKQPALHGAEANLAARPVPQPFSRGSGRAGGCGGGSRTCCCPCSATCPFPCARRTASLAPPSPPPKLPTAPGPRAAAAATAA